MEVLDLFSGIGGFSLGLERAGMETVAFCEIDPFCRQVLKKHWPEVPIFEDIRTLKGEDIEPIDLICGGYPCQPFSTAGKRKGAEDDRHLWPEYLRLIRELRPRWVIGENVAGHISMGIDNVLSDLEGEGYTWEAFVIPACAVDAKHRRDRVWVVANSESIGHRKGRESGNIPEKDGRQNGQMLAESCLSSEASEVMANANSLRRGSEQISRSKCKDKTEFGNDGEKEPMANSSSERLQGRICGELRGFQQEKESFKRRSADRRTTEVWREWPVEPSVGRVANGIPRRVDRLRGLGNAVVPQIPEIIGRAIMEIEG